MIQAAGGAVAAEQIEDLRERMRLLQGDRRANVDILEANKGANKEEIRRLREENKQLRMAVAAFQRGTGSGPEGLAEQLVRARKHFDVMREQGKKKELELHKMADSVRDLELEAKRPTHEDSPVTRNIRVLENRLDKALIKFNEAQSIKKTYEQIVKRLREERIGFDHQLAALDRTYNAKQRDFDELLLLSGDANHAREVAQSELEHVRSGYEEERKRREAELRERHLGVQLRKQTLDRIAKRERMRQEILARERSGEDDRLDMDEDHHHHHHHHHHKALMNGTKSSASTAGSAQTSASAYSKERMEQRTKIDIFEAAFRKIKEATGVSDVNEVIQKIVSQESTTENLMTLTKENQKRIEELNESKAAIKAHVEEIKYSGPGGGHRRKMVDDREEHVAASAARLERQRTKYERLAKMLIAVKAGVKHLQDKLEGVRDDIGGKLHDLTDDTTVRVMAENEKMMLELLARIRVATEDERALHHEAMAAASSNASFTSGANSVDNDHEPLPLATSTNDDDVDESELLRTRPYNRRIELPLLDEDGEEAEPALAKDDMAAEPPDDELTRDKVKKASSQILYAQEKRLKKKTNKTRAATGANNQTENNP